MDAAIRYASTDTDLRRSQFGWFNRRYSLRCSDEVGRCLCFVLQCWRRAPGRFCFFAGSASGKRHELPIVLAAQFDPKEVEWATKPGTAAIIGSAALRTRGGDVKSCGGLAVDLIPYSTYAAARMRYIYGEGDAGVSTGHKPFASTDAGYTSTIIEAHCDAQGAFQFDHLAAGRYFVTVTITWQAGVQTGAALMRDVTLTEGSIKRVVLTS